MKVGFKGVYFSWTCFPDTEKKKKKTPDTTPNRTLLVFYVSRAGLEPTPDTAVR